MVYSMTAFGRSQNKNEWGEANWELRSINHRYLEIVIRLPDILRELEQPVREIITSNFQRGKIECVLHYQPSAKIGKLSLNSTVFEQLTKIIDEIDTERKMQLNVMDILDWDGVVNYEKIDINLIKDSLSSLLSNAIIDLKSSRAREGENLRLVIKEKLAAISEQVSQIKQQLPKTIEQQRDKIREKFEEIKLNLEAQRLEQEMVLFVQKIDISEELDRLQSHITEVERTLNNSELAIGRRLDFMMQELNREANTLASKSADPLIIHAAVEMKVLIEQIREQVQNIE